MIIFVFREAGEEITPYGNVGIIDLGAVPAVNRLSFQDTAATLTNGSAIEGPETGEGCQGVSL